MSQMTLRVDFSGSLVPPVKAWFFTNSLSLFLVLLSLCLIDFLVGAFKPGREIIVFCWGSLNWALRVYQGSLFVRILLPLWGSFAFWVLRSGIWWEISELSFGIIQASEAWDLKEFWVSLSKEKGMFFCFWISALLGFDICYFWWGWFVLCLRSCELFRVVLSLNVEVLGFVWSFEWFCSVCGYIEELSIWFAETVGIWAWITRKIASVCAFWYCLELMNGLN